MEEKIKIFFANKLFKFVGMPFLLLLLWAALTLQYIVTFDTSFLIIPYNHSLSDLKTVTFQPLTKRKSISGEFMAKGNNLGIIQMRFNYHKHIAYINEDNVLFRIKEKGAKNWYYQSVYKSGLVSDVPFLPFGFPQIVNSKGKTYIFELTSLNGNAENAVSIKNRFPVFISKYKILKSDIVQNKAGILSFIEKKYIRGLENSDILFSSIIYALPFFFYLLLISPIGFMLIRPMRIAGVKVLDILENFEIFGHKLYLVTIVKKTVGSYFDMILLFIILIDIFIMQVPNDTIYIVILILWWYFRKIYKRSVTGTFVIGLSFLMLSPFLLAFNLYEAGEKSTTWAYMFLLLWFIQTLFLLNKNNKFASKS